MEQLVPANQQRHDFDPYTTYVRPAMDQQNFNAHVSEQINGVQTMQRGYGAGTPGMEVNIGRERTGQSEYLP